MEEEEIKSNLLSLGFYKFNELKYIVYGYLLMRNKLIEINENIIVNISKRNKQVEITYRQDFRNTLLIWSFLQIVPNFIMRRNRVIFILSRQYLWPLLRIYADNEALTKREWIGFGMILGSSKRPTVIGETIMVYPRPKTVDKRKLAELVGLEKALKIYSATFHPRVISLHYLLVVKDILRYIAKNKSILNYAPELLNVEELLEEHIKVEAEDTLLSPYEQIRNEIYDYKSMLFTYSPNRSRWDIDFL